MDILYEKWIYTMPEKKRIGYTGRMEKLKAVFFDRDGTLTRATREQGFTSFHLDRKGKKSGEWVIRDLHGLVDYVAGLGS